MTMLEEKEAYRYLRWRLGFFLFWRCRIADALIKMRRRAGIFAKRTRR